MVAQFDNVSQIPRERPFLPFVDPKQLELYVLSYTIVNKRQKTAKKNEFVELYWLTLSELEPLVLSKSRYRLPRVPVLQHFAVNTELALLLNKPRNWLSAGAKPLSVPRLIFFFVARNNTRKNFGKFLEYPDYFTTTIDISGGLERSMTALAFGQT